MILMIQPSGYPTQTIPKVLITYPSKSVLGDRVQSPMPDPLPSLSPTSPHTPPPPTHPPPIYRAIFTEHKYHHITSQLKNLSGTDPYPQRTASKPLRIWSSFYCPFWFLCLYAVDHSIINQLQLYCNMNVKLMLISTYHFMGPYIRILYALFSKNPACLKIIHVQKPVKHLHSEGFPNHSSLHSLRCYHYTEHMLPYLSVSLSSQLHCRLLECRDGISVFFTSPVLNSAPDP